MLIINMINIIIRIFYNQKDFCPQSLLLFHSLLYDYYQLIIFYIYIFILLIFVLLSVLFKASEDIILRYIGKKIHYLIIPFLYSGVGFFVYLLQIIVFNENKGLIIELSFFDWIIIFLIAFLSVSYQALMALAFGNENAGRASMINYFQILFTFIADIIIFNRQTVILDYIGILLIFGFNFTNGCIKIYYRSKGIVYNKIENENI